jgi:hypothetical protein
VALGGGGEETLLAQQVGAQPQRRGIAGALVEQGIGGRPVAERGQGAGAQRPPRLAYAALGVDRIDRGQRFLGVAQIEQHAGAGLAQRGQVRLRRQPIVERMQRRSGRAPAQQILHQVSPPVAGNMGEDVVGERG